MNAQLVPVPADSLIAAYAATDFVVLALRPITLRVDQVVANLDDWHPELGHPATISCVQVDEDSRG